MTDKSYESSMETSEEEKKSKSNRIWKILVILLLILLLFVVTAGVVIFVPMIHDTTGNSGVGMTVDPFAGDYVDKNQEPSVNIPGWFTIYIPADTLVVETVELNNPNDDYYYLTFKLSLLDENGEISETLYESGLLPPGDHIQTITLSRGLAKGEYDAILEVQPYRIEDQTPTNGANSKLTLIVN